MNGLKHILFFINKADLIKNNTQDVRSNKPKCNIMVISTKLLIFHTLISHKSILN